MKITNNPGLSQAWVNAVSRDEHEHMGDRSMTELLKPVRVHQLRRRHDAVLTSDVSDGIWILLGKAVHYVLEQASDPGSITEQRFNVDVDGYKLSVCPDRVEKIPIDQCERWWNPNIQEPRFICGRWECPTGMQLYRLKDFKISQVYAYMRMIEASGKDEWRLQVNGYAWALWQAGFPVVEAGIEILMKDWDWMEANVKKTRDYPPYQVAHVPVELMNPDHIRAFLSERLLVHMAAETLPDTELPHCTMDERWATKDRFAVKKAGSDRAMPGASSLDSEMEAHQFIIDAIGKAMQKKKPEMLTENDFTIEFRKGESKRCERYCPCKSVCDQYATLINPPF